MNKVLIRSSRKGKHCLYNNMFIVFKKNSNICPSGSLVGRMCSKLTLTWSSIKNPQFFPLNKDTHCLLLTSILSSAHLSQRHIHYDNSGTGCFIPNEDIASLIPYTKYKFSPIKLQRVKLFGLSKTYCAYLQVLLYIKLDNVLSGSF